MGLFSRRRKAAVDTGGLGFSLIALRLDQGDLAPAPCTVVVFNAGGHARRLAAGRIVCDAGEQAFCFHPGPYSVDLAPFAAAPEWGLRLRFVIDAANPRVTQQRFDLFLFSEAGAQLSVAGFCATVEAALQMELAQGSLELPPCTSIDEWHAFRAALNQLLYTRYGVIVDDCVPVDLGQQVDFAEVLKQRARKAAEVEMAAAAAAAAVKASAAAIPAAEAMTTAAMPAGTGVHAPDTPATQPSSPAMQPVKPGKPATEQTDARALRRLFLELPALSGGYRLLALPDGLPLFQQHQALLQRLGLAALAVGTMPALAWAAPDQPLAPAGQQRRSLHAAGAASALDEAWSLLARLQLTTAPQWTGLIDEADRIFSNLEFHLAQRRAPYALVSAPDDAPGPSGPGPQRREPSL